MLHNLLDVYAKSSFVLHQSTCLLSTGLTGAFDEVQTQPDRHTHITSYYYYLIKLSMNLFNRYIIKLSMKKIKIKNIKSRTR